MSLPSQNSSSMTPNKDNMLETWKKAIETMTFKEIVLLEYNTKSNSTFRKMFPATQNASVKSSRCNLCETASLTNFPSLLQHINGKKHATKVVSLVEEYRHPSINPLENQDMRDKVDDKEIEMDKIGDSKIVINPFSVSSNETKSIRDVVADKKALKESMNKMTLDDLLLIEYRFINTDWKKLFEQSSNFVICVMCNSTPLPHLSAIRQHLSDRKHLTNINLTKGLYHPKYAPIKEQENCDKIIEDNEKEENSNESSQKPSIDDNNQIDNSNSEITSSTSSSSQNPDKSTSETKVPLSVEKPTTITVTSKQKSLTNMFRTKMLTLNIDDLKKIEYRYITGIWKKMLTQISQSQIKCVLCNIVIIQNLGDIKQHIAGKKHQLLLDSTALLYHPVLANTKLNAVEKEFSKLTPVKDDILDDKTFREQIVKLTLEELQEVEYTIDNKTWTKLLLIIHGTYKCTLCSASNISCLQNFFGHLKGKRHAEKTSSIIRFYHPKLTAKKDVNIAESVRKSPSSTTVSASVTKAQSSTTTSNVTSTVTTISQSSSSTSKPSNATSSTPKQTIAIPSTSKQVIVTPLSSPALSSKSSEKTQTELEKELDNVESPRSESHNNSEHKNRSKRIPNCEERIVCTIELEDSPEREIKKEKIEVEEDENEELPLRVINPSALIASSPIALRSKTNLLQNTEQNTISERASNSSEKSNTPDSYKNSSPSNNRIMENQSLNFIPLNENSSDIYKFSQQNKNSSLSQTEITPPRRSQNNKNKNEDISFSTKVLFGKIERDVEGLIGVEYVVKILRNINDNTPRYECCLCEVEVDGAGMQWHLKGLNHRIKFLERHFPTAMREFTQYKNNVNMSAVMTQIAEKLAIAIEEYHGKDLPYECLSDEFRSNRHGVMSKVFSFKHASELNGPSFTDVVDKTTIDEFIAKKATYKTSEPDLKRKPTFDVKQTFPSQSNKRPRNCSPKLGVEEHKRLVEQFLENTNRSGNRHKSPPSSRRRRSKSPPYSHRRGVHQRRSRSPRQSRDRRSRSRSRDRDRNRRYSKRIHNSPTREGDIWQRYRRQFDRALENLENQYEKYRNDPETHPRYDDEWKQFWSKKTDELLAEGRDPTSYDFQPEWVKFFIRRIDELYENAVEDIRIKLRQELGLGLQNTELMDNRYHVGINRNGQPNENFSTFLERQNVKDQTRIEQHQQINMQPPQMQRMHYMQQTQQMQQMYQMPPQIQYPIQQHQMQQPQMQPQFQMQHHQHQQQKQQHYMYQQQQQQQQYQPPVQALQGSSQTSSTGSRPIEISASKMPEPKPVSPPKEKEKPQSPPPKIASKKKSQNRDDLELDPDTLTPISVLRILTALEDQLGSLGPKVIDLLSKALTLEKVKPNAPPETLLTVEHCVFLETVREKLKGQLLAGVVDSSKIRAVKKAVKDVTKLLDDVNERRDEAEMMEPPQAPIISNFMAKTSTSAKSSPDNDTRDLTSKLVAALAAQGRTDVSAKELKELVQVYSMIDKKSRESNATTPRAINQQRPQQQQQKQQQQNQPPKKSLSDTLAALMRSSNDSNKRNETQPLNKDNNNSWQNEFSNPPRPSLQGTTASTSTASTSNLSKESTFRSSGLSNFDTSFKTNNRLFSGVDSNKNTNTNTNNKPNSIPSYGNQNRQNYMNRDRNTNNAVNSFQKTSSNTNQNSNFTGNIWQNTQRTNIWQGSTGSNTYGQQQQSQIPSLLTVRTTAQDHFGGGGNQRGQNTNQMVSYPNNMRSNQQTSGFNNQTPMGWGGGGRYENRR